MRSFSRSHTYTRSSGSTPMPCGRWNSPGPTPTSPQDSSSSPSGEKAWTRQLPYPSATYTRPAELIARLVQALNGSPGRTTVSTLWMTKGPPSARPVSEGCPGRPRVISSFPSGVNFRTEWSPLSTVHTESSGPTVSPCGLVKPSPPHAVMNVPSGSYTSTLESNLVSRYTRSAESMPTADTSRWVIPAGTRSHCASASYLKPSARGGLLSPRTASPHWSGPGREALRRDVLMLGELRDDEVEGAVLDAAVIDRAGHEQRGVVILVVGVARLALKEQLGGDRAAH